MAIYQVSIRFSQQALGSAVNVFWFEAGIQSDVPQFLSDVADWVEDMYDTLRPHMDQGTVFASGAVNRMNINGTIAEVMGSINPVISGQDSGQQLALPTAGSVFARTGEPGVRGSKRLPGIVEDVLVDGLFTNAILQAMLSFAASWILGPSAFGVGGAFAGVLSSKLEAFAPFSGSGATTNVPGTQVTRKPLRGS